jgi:hypothetical protein
MKKTPTVPRLPGTEPFRKPPERQDSVVVKVHWLDDSGTWHTETFTDRAAAFARHDELQATCGRKAKDPGRPYLVMLTNTGRD